jgi:hypothetical protein
MSGTSSRRRQTRADVRTGPLTGLLRGDATTAAAEYLARTRVAPVLTDAASRQRLIDEHARNPLPLPATPDSGPRLHSRDLACVLDHFHAASTDGKYVLFRSRAYGDWHVARISGVRGEAPVPIDVGPFDARGKAEHAVFLLRVDEFVRRWG